MKRKQQSRTDARFASKKYQEARNSDSEEVMSNEESKSESESESDSESEVDNIMDISESGDGLSDDEAVDSGESSGENENKEGLAEDDEGQNWGAMAKAYYHRRSGKGTEDRTAKEELTEATRLQKAQLGELDEEDVELDSESESEDEASEQSSDSGEDSGDESGMPGGDKGTEEHMNALAKLSEEERERIVSEDAPELAGLLEDYYEKLSVVRGQLRPLIDAVKEGKLPTFKGLTYLEVKAQLLLNYCMNVAFYMLLKAAGRPVRDHPVITHLVKIRSYIEKLKVVDKKVEQKVSGLLALAKRAEEGDIEDAETGERVKPELLVAAGDGDSEEEGATQSGTYKPKKLVPERFDEGKPEKRAATRRSKNVVAMMRQEIGDEPEEVAPQVAELAKDTGEDAETDMYEEKYLKRLGKAKKGKAVSTSLDVDDLDGLGEFIDGLEESRASREADGKEAIIKARREALSDVLRSVAKEKVQLRSGDMDVPFRDPAELGIQRKRRAARSLQESDDSEEEGAQSEDLSEDDFYAEAANEQSKKKARRAAPEEEHVAFDDSVGEDGKREATYDIVKNRGITRKRNKEVRNPRVKYRNKFDSKSKKVRSTGKKMRDKSEAYAGESTGIRTKVSKSRKFRS